MNELVVADSPLSQGRRAIITQEIARVRLFLASYAPMFLILAIRFDAVALRSACGILAAIGIVDATLIIRRSRRKLATVRVRIYSVADAGSESSGYLVSYLLPFVTVATPSGRDLAGYGLFLIVALVIYIRSNLVQVNPVFYLLGYRVLRIKYGAEGERLQFLVTRVSPSEGESIGVADFAGIFLAKGGANGT